MGLDAGVLERRRSGVDWAVSTPNRPRSKPAGNSGEAGVGVIGQTEGGPSWTTWCFCAEGITGLSTRRVFGWSWGR
jgi:hypothetical protein